MRKIFLGLLIAVVSTVMVISFLLSGCAAEQPAAEEEAKEEVAEEEAGTQLELSIMHQFPRADTDNQENVMFNELSDEYVAAHPEIKFNITAIDQTDFHVKLQALAAGDDLPDVFFVKGSWITNFVENDLLLDFTPYFEDCPWKDSYRMSMLEAFKRDGKLYGLPIQFAPTSILYYNSDLWKSIGYDSFPMDWDEIKSAAKKFEEEGITPFAAGNKDSWFFESCWLSTLGDRFTGTEWTQNIILDNGKSKFTDPEFVASLEFLLDLAQAGLFNVDFNAITGQQMITLYSTGKAASTVDGYWAIGSINAQAPPEILEATKITIIPPVPDQKGDPNTISGGAGWSIGANNHIEGEKRDLAADYCLYMTGYEYSKRLLEKFGIMGAHVVEDIDISQFNQLTQDYFNLMNDVGFTPIYDIQMEASVIETMNSGLQSMLNGDISPQQLAEDIQAEQDKL